MFSFKEIHKNGQVISEQSEYKQVHDSHMLSRYDSNFVKWYELPSLTKLQQVEQGLKAFHHQYGQQHMKFIFPENQKIPDVLLGYLQEQNYGVSFLELYAIAPEVFQATRNESVHVDWVAEGSQADFLQLQYVEDVKYSEDFAKQKQQFLCRMMQEVAHHQIIAYVDGEAVGSVELIEKEGTVEIDNLFVVESKQRQGIGSQIQRFVMDYFAHKTIILVADGEDTPRDMYQRQGYTYQGFQYEALLVIEK